MKNAVVFDLDGTLLDTLEDLCASLNHTLSVFGYKACTLEDTRRYIGNGIRKLIERGCNDDIDTSLKFEEFKKYYTVNCNNNTKPYPNIYKLLDLLKAKGYRLGVVSNKAKYALDILVDAHFKGYFDVVIGDGMGIKKKPAPDALIEACRCLDTKPENIYYIGDGDTDVLTAINACSDGLFVTYGFRGKEDLKKAGAKLLFDSVDELIAFFNK